MVTATRRLTKHSHHYTALDSLFGDYIQVKKLPQGDLDWVGTHIWKDVVNLQGPAVGEGIKVLDADVCCVCVGGWGGCCCEENRCEMKVLSRVGLERVGGSVSDKGVKEEYVRTHAVERMSLVSRGRRWRG